MKGSFAEKQDVLNVTVIERIGATAAVVFEKAIKEPELSPDYAKIVKKNSLIIIIHRLICITHFP